MTTWIPTTHVGEVLQPKLQFTLEGDNTSVWTVESIFQQAQLDAIFHKFTTKEE